MFSSDSNHINTNPLPDVTSNTLTDSSLPLQWVGMEKIGVPLTLALDNGKHQSLAAQADIFVSLDQASAKGIHMSRLHAILNTLDEEPFTKSLLDRLLDEAVSSQAGISNNAKITLTFDLLLKKPALLSNESGFQAYSVVVNGEVINGSHAYDIDVTIPYSSTCPCSASLSRQLYANAISEAFDSETIDKASLLQWIQSDQGSVATPHSQRSYAYIKMSTSNNPWPALDSLIRHFEEVIGTSVQTAVKRIDEQEFARLNANNLMFCEDAARRIKACLETLPYVTDYWFKVEHQESLHAHNAVVIDQK
ncbi:GTP cyclohydrolase FolE2 [Maricurvus nonylphenolicus]|uniref:GTP cyclohydrolase FolE2 n=1 Tax=Maricurvus nonylphenolicus TaxID=1008307 RepID=UPI0036F208BC